MSREWPEGTVAMVTWTVNGEPRTEMRFRYNRKVVGHVWESADGTWIGDSTAKDVRPLVVIDPEDAEQVNRLAEIINKHDGSGADWPADLGAALREFADPKPRIEEPRGLGAVVEDAEGADWHRTRDGRWISEDGLRSRACGWDHIGVARVLSEGVTE